MSALSVKGPELAIDGSMIFIPSSAIRARPPRSLSVAGQRLHGRLRIAGGRERGVGKAGEQGESDDQVDVRSGMSFCITASVTDQFMS